MEKDKALNVVFVLTIVFFIISITLVIISICLSNNGYSIDGIRCIGIISTMLGLSTGIAYLIAKAIKYDNKHRY